jgi:hypothetical protein
MKSLQWMQHSVSILQRSLSLVSMKESAHAACVALRLCSLGLLECTYTKRQDLDMLDTANVCRLVAEFKQIGTEACGLACCDARVGYQANQTMPLWCVYLQGALFNLAALSHRKTRQSLVRGSTYLLGYLRSALSLQMIDSGSLIKEIFVAFLKEVWRIHTENPSLVLDVDAEKSTLLWLRTGYSDNQTRIQEIDYKMVELVSRYNQVVVSE